MRTLKRRAEELLANLQSADDFLDLAIVGDRAMRKLNRTFRCHAETTDVLSFAPTPGGEPENLTGAGTGSGFWPARGFLGEVVISIDQVLIQAAEDALSFEKAFERLLIHGVLHLKGYDHGNPKEAARIRRREKKLQAGLWKAAPPPYIG